MCAGNPCGQVNGHRHAQTPNDTDFPLSEAGTCYFKCRNAAHTEENQQPGTEKLGDALTF